MNRSRNAWLIVMIVILVAFSLWVDLSKSITIQDPLNNATLVSRKTDIQLGLDLRGGLQTLLQADVANCASVKAADLETTRTILQNRANALGVSEITMQTAGSCRIVAEFPGVSNPEEVVAALQQTALLEFIDAGDTPLTIGTKVQTDYGQASTTTPPTATPAAATATPSAMATVTSTASPTPAATVYHTVMTGAALSTVGVQVGSKPGTYQISFTLKPNSIQLFADYTSSHIGKILAIVLDKSVISSPSIQSAITGGDGSITGSFTSAEANSLAVQLRYGSLPVPVKVVESQTVGATLGEDSVRRSLTAGAIGLAVVILFMAFYYRLPGVVADLALITYALVSFMLFKMIPVTLSLPGIAGFILSIGMAVDANVLIFERLREELRAGRTLSQAIDLGWSRAWPSIRDSNSSTLITCLILYIFGNSFGASMVKGFSINLALGVVVSLFTAIIVTRTYLHLVLDNLKLGEHPRWFGL